MIFTNGGRLNLFLACFIYVIFCYSSSSFASNGSCVISLEGVHKFSAGDDLSWASPGLDDSAWSSIHVPGGWQSQGIDPKNGLGWYRIHFLIPNDFIEADSALLLGRIMNADEVFLNGERIGGEGTIANEFVEASRTHRLYRIPRGLLRPGADNLISIRALNTFQDGGLVTGPVCIGEYEGLLAWASLHNYTNKSAETVVIVLSFLAALAALILYRIDPEEREFLFFALLVSTVGITDVLDSQILYESGLKSFWVMRAGCVVTFLIPSTILWFVSSFNRKPLRLPGQVLIYLSMLTALAPFSFSTLEDYFLFYKVAVFLGVIVLIVSLFHTLDAYRKGYHEAGYIAVGVTILIFAAILRTIGVELLHISDPVAFDWGLLLLELCCAFGLIARYARTRKELKSLSGRILDAHEEERRRLSREIHDGIGQSLHAIKFQLQILKDKIGLQSTTEKEVWPMLISEVSESIEDLRYIAMDLRPNFLEEATILDAFKWYGGKFSDRTGIRLEVEGDETVDAPLRVKDHLYRIYQEVLTNAAKHAEADLIVVRAERVGERLAVTIADNGKSFDFRRSVNASQGLGLSTMKERTELLRGSFRLESAPGKGTTIHIEVPIP